MRFRANDSSLAAPWQLHTTASLVHYDFLVAGTHANAARAGSVGAPIQIRAGGVECNRPVAAAISSADCIHLQQSSVARRPKSIVRTRPTTAGNSQAARRDATIRVARNRETENGIINIINKIYVVCSAYGCFCYHKSVLGWPKNWTICF